MLKKYNRKPDFWAKDVKECQSELQAAVQRRNYFVPHDLAASVGEEEALLLLQRIVLKFGRVMQIWPDLTEAMMQCRKQGRPIGEQL